MPEHEGRGDLAGALREVLEELTHAQLSFASARRELREQSRRIRSLQRALRRMRDGHDGEGGIPEQIRTIRRDLKPLKQIVYGALVLAATALVGSLLFWRWLGLKLFNQ